MGPQQCVVTLDDTIPARKVVFSNKNQICMYTSSPRKAVGDIMPVLLATTMAIPKHCWSLSTIIVNKQFVRNETLLVTSNYYEQTISENW